MANDKTKKLTQSQTMQQNFITDLSDALLHSDITALDLRVELGEYGNTYNALVENYEINIARTPVYAYPGRLHRLLCVGSWVFKPGTYERYQVQITENSANLRLDDIVERRGYSGLNYNIVAQFGTMATDLGYYYCTHKQINGEDDTENLYMLQNAHLFAPSQKIYNILDSEYMRREQSRRNYPLSELRNDADRRVLYTRMLDSVRTKLK